MCGQVQQNLRRSYISALVLQTIKKPAPDVSLWLKFGYFKNNENYLAQIPILNDFTVALIGDFMLDSSRCPKMSLKSRSRFM